MSALGASCARRPLCTCTGICFAFAVLLGILLATRVTPYYFEHMIIAFLIFFTAAGVHHVVCHHFRQARRIP